MTVARYIEIVTLEGDRWDLIADRAYGDPYDYERIIAANPHIPIRPVLPAGLRVRVPVVEAPSVGGLPPWKAGAS